MKKPKNNQISFENLAKAKMPDGYIKQKKEVKNESDLPLFSQDQTNKNQLNIENVSNRAKK